MPTRTPLVLLAGFLLLALLAPAARGETVRLRSGKALRVERVRFLEGRLDITLRRDGGTVRIEMPFERIDARNLLALWDRTTDAHDAVLVLAGARLALGLDLRGEAAKRLHAAAGLDPALAGECDAGLAGIRALETAEGIADLEARVRAGNDPQSALTLAAALLEGPQAASLSAVQHRRVRALGALARRVAARDVRREAEAHAAAAAPAAPAAAPDDAAPDALAAVRDRIALHEAKARIAREAAADPKVGVRRAIRHLEAVARALLDARRRVREAPKGLAASLGETDERLRLGILATYLELADLHRQEGRFDRARAHLRAVLILDPGNEDAWAQRGLIEEDLRREPFGYADSYGSGFQSYYWSPSPFYRAYRGLASNPYGLHRYHPQRHGGVHLHGVYGHGSFGVHFRTGHTHPTGTRRVVGRRR